MSKAEQNLLSNRKALGRKKGVESELLAIRLTPGGFMGLGWGSASLVYE